MDEQRGPNVATSLFVLHQVITRGLAVSIERADGLAQDGFGDDETCEGFCNYVLSLGTVLHAHHLTEDEITFPYFREKLPEVPFDQLISEHQEMVTLLEEVKELVEEVAGARAPTKDLEKLGDVARHLEQKWHPHIAIEEEGLAPAKLQDLLPAEEHMRLIQLHGSFGQEHSKPPQLTIPFILYNLPPEVRAVMSQAMPAEVVQQLVPVVWLEQWESMKPFLLE